MFYSPATRGDPISHIRYLMASRCGGCPPCQPLTLLNHNSPFVLQKPLLTTISPSLLLLSTDLEFSAIHQKVSSYFRVSLQSGLLSSFLATSTSKVRAHLTSRPLNFLALQETPPHQATSTVTPWTSITTKSCPA